MNLKDFPIHKVETQEKKDLYKKNSKLITRMISKKIYWILLDNPIFLVILITWWFCKIVMMKMRRIYFRYEFEDVIS